VRLSATVAVPGVRLGSAGQKHAQIAAADVVGGDGCLAGDLDQDFFVLLAQAACEL
jgi:hypothetical protein